MYCAKCGAQVDAGTSYCQKCGTAASQPVVAQPPAAAVPPVPIQAIPGAKTSSMAIASLVLGIVGLVFFPFIPPVLAIIFGAIGISQVNRSGGVIKGKGLALAGLVLGIIAIAMSVILVILVGYTKTWISDIGSGIQY